MKTKPCLVTARHSDRRPRDRCAAFDRRTSDFSRIVSDRRLVPAKGCCPAILSETPEIYRSILSQLSRRQQRIGESCSSLKCEGYAADKTARGQQPSPGNKAGGLTRSSRSRWVRAKAGQRSRGPLSLCRAGDQARSLFMDTPGYDRLGDRPGGGRRQHVCFTTGRAPASLQASPA